MPLSFNSPQKLDFEINELLPFIIRFDLTTGNQVYGDILSFGRATGMMGCGNLVVLVRHNRYGFKTNCAAPSQEIMVRARACYDAFTVFEQVYESLVRNTQYAMMIAFDGAVASIYVDGVLKSSRSVDTSAFPLDGVFSVCRGRYSPQLLQCLNCVVAMLETRMRSSVL